MTMKIPIASRLPLILLLLFAVLRVGAEGRFFGAMETVYPTWFKDSFLDLKEDVAEAAAEGRRLVIFFHQNGCPYCNLLVERNLSQRDIEQTLRTKTDVVAVNMFGDRELATLDGHSLTEKDFAAAMRVQFTPTLLFFDEQGRVILRLNGYIPPHDFKLALDYVTGRNEAHASYRDYLAANRPAAPSGSLISEEYHQAPPYLLNTREAKPLAVFFEQTQCPECDRMHRDLLSGDGIRTLLEAYDVVQLDMWSQTPLITPRGERSDARSWARSLSVNYAPTFILFDAEGNEVIRSEAMFKQFHTESMLDYCLSEAYLREPSFQRYLSVRSEHIREQGGDVDIWK
jgi:thioredoxin-related protein